MAELAVALDEPGADLLLLAWFEDLMGEGAGRACGARADLEKFAWNMGEVFRWEGRRDGFDKEGRGQEEEGGDVLCVEDLCLGPLSLSRSLSLSGASLVASGTDSWSLRCLSAAGILEREEEGVGEAEKDEERGLEEERTRARAGLQGVRCEDALL